ncbi:MAG: class I SAM-dependent methyltransferase [Chloroflexi bacterium]|nr:class I SAM-dependent methyltransferase [Chloroflexota bacterium]
MNACAPGAHRSLVRLVLGWLFERLYNELAFAYDAVSWIVSGGRWRHWQREALPAVVGRRILEIGPGPGHLLAALSEAGHEVVGLDCSPAMIALARRCAPAARLVRADARVMPFTASSFDTVVATFPAGYVRERAFYSEVARVLRPGGRLVVVLGATSEARYWPRPVEWLLALGSGPGGDERAILEGTGLTGGVRVVATPFGRVTLLVAELPTVFRACAR